MADDNTKSLIILGVAAIGAWYLYEQGYLYEWTGLAALYPGTLPTTATTTTTAVSVSPASATVSPGGTQQFSVANLPSGETVTWSLSGAGSISSGGLYTAPSSVSAASTVTVYASYNGTVIGSATVSLTASASSSSSTSTTTSSPTVELTGPVTSDVNNSLAADVSINGSVQNLACISGGECYDTSGHGVTLPSGVTAAQIYALMQAAKSAGTSGLGMFSGTRVPMRSIHGIGYAKLRRGVLQ